MNLEEHLPIIAELFELVDEWSVCDDRDDDKHMVLVDENRDTHPTLLPEKTLVYALIDRGYLEYEEWSEHPDQQREYVVVPLGYTGPASDPTPVPKVLSFRVTASGRRFILGRT